MNAQEIQSVRNEYHAAPKMSAGNTHIAVIVETKISARKKWAGVQYWTPEMIAAAVRINDDRSVSTYIENL
jgi:hypothetical protein